MKIKSAVLVGAILTLGFFPAPVLAIEDSGDGQVVLAAKSPKKRNNSGKKSNKKSSKKSNKKSNKGSNKNSGKGKTGESAKQSGSTGASTGGSSGSDKDTSKSGKGSNNAARSSRNGSSSASVASTGTVEKGKCPAGSAHVDKAYGPNEKLQTVSSCYIKDNKNDLMPTASRLINVVVGVIGFVAVIMIILGAVQFLTSTGDASKVKKAKDTILYGVIGLVVAILAFSIVNFVLSSVSKGGTGTDSSSSENKDEDSDDDEDDSGSESYDDSDEDSDDNALEEDAVPDEE